MPWQFPLTRLFMTVTPLACRTKMPSAFPMDMLLRTTVAAFGESPT